MCGIAGLLTAGSGDADGTSAILQNMTRSLAHRGPDAEGYWMEGEVALGHRRLSILDLSDAGAQPMRSESGRHVIVFNGEIYNHLNMRRDIAADGAAPDWRGHSDTETLLAGITHWGHDETLQRTKGMFALALWDRSEKRLSLARDRMGEKPLYWGWAGQALVFGSELKALRTHPNCPRDVCRAARQHVTVALSGDGGDELFGGYNRYFWGPKIWDRFALLPHPLRQGLGKIIRSVPLSVWDAAGSNYNRLRSGSTGISRLGDKAHRLGDRLRTVKTTDDLYRSLVSEWSLEAGIMLGISEDPTSQLDDPLPENGVDDPAMQMMVQDMRSYLPDDILCKVDRAAMGVSLETRTPFLDPDVIALAARLPMALKIHEGQGKWALRQVLYQHVPREMIERPKAGFAIPIGIWLRGPLRDWAEELLSHESLEKDGFFDPEIIRQAWAEHLSGRRDWTTRLWAILMFQAWHAQWV